MSMSFLRQVYDQLTDSSSSLGKVGKYAYPFNAPYLTRDLWRKYGKNLFASPTSASGISVYGGSGSVYGPTGSIVGKY